MQNNSSHVTFGAKRWINGSEAVFVEYPFFVISVALLAAVVQRATFLLVFVVLYDRIEGVFVFQKIVIQEFWESVFRLIIL